MTIFTILFPAPNPTLSAAIADRFGADCLALNDTQWLVSSSATIQEVTAKAGIFDARNPDTQTPRHPDVGECCCVCNHFLLWTSASNSLGLDKV